LKREKHRDETVDATLLSQSYVRVPGRGDAVGLAGNQIADMNIGDISMRWTFG
jgi:hypothetical protein